MQGLAEDTGVVYLHQLLPDDLTGGIPSIANGWDNFLRDASGQQDPGRLQPAFADSLRPGGRAALWYVHFMLPAQPLAIPALRPQLLDPTGARLGAGRGLEQQSGRGRPVLAAAPAPARLLRPRARQASRPPQAVGALRRRARDRHGRPRRQLQGGPEAPAALPGEPRRTSPTCRCSSSSRTSGAGRMERAPARTIDIFPTIASAIGVRIPWRVDGHSLLGDRPDERHVVLVKDGGKRYVVPVAALEARRARALRRQLRLFGSGRAAVEPLRRRVPGAGALESLDRGTPSPPRDSTRSTVRATLFRSADAWREHAATIAVVVGRKESSRSRRPSTAASGPWCPKARLGAETPADLLGARSVARPARPPPAGRAGRPPAVLGTNGRRSSLVKPLSPAHVVVRTAKNTIPRSEVPRSFEG